MPLIIAPMGINLRVIRILVDEKAKKHLESLGITINSIIQILDSSGGSVIVKVKEGRLALDKSLSTKIIVEEGE